MVVHIAPVTSGRAPTTEEDKKAAEKKREDKAKKKHDRKSKRLDEEEEDNEGGEWERVRGGVPLVKVSVAAIPSADGRLGRADGCPPGWGGKWQEGRPAAGHLMAVCCLRRSPRCSPRARRSLTLSSSRS